jgi:hypothetical protein
MSMKNSNDTIGNRFRDLLVCSVASNGLVSTLNMYNVIYSIVESFSGHTNCLISDIVMAAILVIIGVRKLETATLDMPSTLYSKEQP